EQIHRLTGVNTEVMHNGSTSVEVAGDLGSHLLTGVARLAWYAFNSKDTKTRDQGLDSLHRALKIWMGIQETKGSCAQTLVGRVQAYLDANPQQDILLIFHSQGTHVGLQALSELQDYRGRIHVIGMGGMVRIPESLAKTVVNFAHTDDPVSNYVAPVVGPHGERVEIGEGGHNASSYLENPSFVNYLLGHRIIEQAPALGESRMIAPIHNPSLMVEIC
ncbi:MAG: hypothetical protein KDD43_14035, partial [Bdellovibrionales bacterium]|nr:hypothetical protein [Bdellovibrionales bacterium]